MRSRASRAWVAAIGLVAACGSPDPDPEPAPIVLGGATRDGSEFVEVDDGADLTLVGGAQGGFHVWTGLRVRGVSGALRLYREARRLSDDQLVLRTSAVVLEVPEDAVESGWVHPDGDRGGALPSFMCPTPIGIAVRDQALRMRAELYSDEEELLGTDELSFVPRCPVDDQDEAEFCAEICSG